MAELQQSVRSRSPSPNSSLQTGLVGDIGDKRKFREGVVEEHFQHHTFAPNLGDRTKELDQKQISKLIGQQNPGSRKGSQSP